MKRGITRYITLLLLLTITASLLIPGAIAAGAVPVTISTGVNGAANPQVDVLWDDAWFNGDPATYNHDLAIASMALSGAAYLSGKKTGVQAALNAMGFGDIRAYNYRPSLETVSQVAAYTFATKTISGVSGGDTYLTAVVIRGTGESMEWAGNLNMGEGQDHEGFAKARNELLARLDEYLTDAGITAEKRQTMKFLITGHSRGAAVANLTAASLTAGARDTDAAIYAYTFASPTVSFDAALEGYGNIFNIVSDDDLVTQVPLPAWGCGRYGVDLHLPTSVRDGAAYDAAFAKMDQTYTALTGKPYTVYRDKDAVQTLTAALRKLVPSASSASMAMLSALLTGNFSGLSGLVRENSITALLLSRRMITMSNELTPLIQREAGGMASAHCMAAYYSWLVNSRTPEEVQALYGQK